ncbi:Glutamate formimidoyltransferase [Neolewinella maritima]|uniref:glutamate formimidoyltransferase n=1 Tax=Neolewinella maritima TaxID=1383882 RepID=A0ABM9B3G9_9BACT|nr:glutamate formimidoyltransferase [Neolewinella maritima]CAH1001468.1 Glutamate formimidoyltransferase [Neolewinella maritima]
MPPSPLLECVVNVSEGRDPRVLQAIAQVIHATPDCYLLHQDTGHGAHRTVFTFAGTPAAVFMAAEEVYTVADRLIDMRQHRGTHPRSGAVDVCPFIPVSGVTEEEARAGTQVLGRRLAERFDLPVYLYADSALHPTRCNLAAIRRGEYEGLTEKLADPEWQPDFGPARPHPRLGITVLGVRPFLIAWNINLHPTATLAQARQLAGRLRGSGTGGRPGLFPGLRAIGWHIDEYDRCQVSCNVVDPDRTPLAQVYLTATGLARELGTEVTGSELVGLVPASHLRAAARGFCWETDYAQEMDLAVLVLGLNELAPFNWQDRVLEEAVRRAVRTAHPNR